LSGAHTSSEQEQAVLPWQPSMVSGCAGSLQPRRSVWSCIKLHFGCTTTSKIESRTLANEQNSSYRHWVDGNFKIWILGHDDDLIVKKREVHGYGSVPIWTGRSYSMRSFRRPRAVPPKVPFPATSLPGKHNRSVRIKKGNQPYCWKGESAGFHKAPGELVYLHSTVCARY
jgi:hypothetical protein